MILPSHGAVRSSVSVAESSAKFRLMRTPSPLLSGARVNSLASPRSTRVFTSLSNNRVLLSQPSFSAARMDASKLNFSLWHPSLGYVFTSDTRVVYPRLPMSRLHSAPAVVSSSEAESSSMADSPASAETPTAADSARDSHHPVTAIPPEAVKRPLVGTSDDPSPRPEKRSCAEEPEDDPDKLEPPFTPLEYKIPADVFRAAKEAPEGSPESFWSYNMYRGPGEDGTLDKDSKIKVHYCTSYLTTERVLQEHFMDEKILGFDIEWEATASSRQGAKRNVSLVQIASKNRIALFHLALFSAASNLVAPSLKKIMEDPTVTKMGVAIKGDCTRLRKHLGIDSRGVFELSNLYKLVKYSTSGEYHIINRRLVSLATQVQEILHLPLFKGQDVRSSSWSQPLKMDQIVYSASDAYAAVQLFAILDHQRQNLDPEPPLPYFVEENKPIRLADGVVLPTADEPPPEEQDGTDATPQPAVSDKYLEFLSDTTKIEKPDGDLSEPIILPKPPAPEKPTPAPTDSRIVDATTRVAERRNAHPVSATAKRGFYAEKYQLRAYYLWHQNEDLGPQQIAELLRTPPLQTTTVVNYILEAIRLEHLQYHKGRLKKELLACVPNDVLASSSRYNAFVKACEEEGDDK